jgi:hypothetical protein
MSTDASGPPQHHEYQDIWRLPTVTALHIRHRQFDPPRRLTVAGKDHPMRDAIEIEIVVSEPFGIRALGLALWVGEEPLTEVESDGKQTYRFFAFNRDSLKPGAPISLSWNTPHPERKQTRYRYDPPSR